MKEFKARLASGACGDVEAGDADQDGAGDRLHLGQLKGHGKMKKIGSVRTATSRPAVLSTASSSRAMPNAQGPGFRIFVDSEKKEPQLPAQSGDWGTVPARTTVNRENELKAGKWNEAKVRSCSLGSIGTTPIASQPTFQIHKDEEDALPAATPRKVIPEVNQVLSARKPQKPINPLQHLMAPACDVKQVAAYCKHLVYVGNQEFSIEEVRAAYLEKKQEQLHLQQLKGCMMTSTGKKSYQCFHCGKELTSAGNLTKHMRTHTGEKPHRCADCGKQFANACDLKTHMMTHTGEKPHKCSDCGKRFALAGTLTLHMMTHTGEKPHKCSVCCKQFAQAGTLKKHMMIHTGEKPHKCSDCGRQFAQASTLKTHMRTHTGDKPHQSKRKTMIPTTCTCTSCGKGYKDTYALRRHIILHTGQDYSSCATCVKGYLRRVCLQKHLSTHLLVPSLLAN